MQASSNSRSLNSSSVIGFSLSNREFLFMNFLEEQSSFVVHNVVLGIFCSILLYARLVFAYFVIVISSLIPSLILSLAINELDVVGLFVFIICDSWYKASFFLKLLLFSPFLGEIFSNICVLELVLVNPVVFFLGWTLIYFSGMSSCFDFLRESWNFTEDLFRLTGGDFLGNCFKKFHIGAAPVEIENIKIIISRKSIPPKV